MKAGSALQLTFTTHLLPQPQQPQCSQSTVKTLNRWKWPAKFGNIWNRVGIPKLEVSVANFLRKFPNCLSFSERIPYYSHRNLVLFYQWFCSWSCDVVSRIGSVIWNPIVAVSEWVSHWPRVGTKLAGQLKASWFAEGYYWTASLLAPAQPLPYQIDLHDQQIAEALQQITNMISN